MGWDQSNTLNSYQLKKGKGKEITGKVTGKSLEAPQNQEFYDEALERQKLQQLCIKYFIEFKSCHTRILIFHHKNLRIMFLLNITRKELLVIIELKLVKENLFIRNKV